MALFPMTNAGASFTLEEPQTVDPYYQGIRTKADFSAAFATLSEGVEYSNGLRLTASGQLSIVDSSSGLPAGTTYVNGLPITSDGKLCVSTNAIASWSNGIAFDAAGAVVEAAFRIASVDPVLWWDAESHRAALAGGAATLFQDSAGTSAVTAVEQPVGRAIDQSGNARHALQATSTARPLLTARKNLLGFSEQFDNSAWLKNAITVGPNTSTSPIGTVTSDKLIASTASDLHYVRQNTPVPGGVTTISLWAKPSGFGHIWVSLDGVSNYVFFDLSGVGSATSTGPSSSIEKIGDYYKCTVTQSIASGTAAVFIGISNASGVLSFAGDGVSGVELWGAQIELGSLATAYQRIAAATDYDITAAPLMLRFDGVDDSIATAPFTAGTLPANADVYIVGARTDASGLFAYASPTGSNYLGVYVAGDGGAANAGSGSPTMHVNGVAVPGGTAVTRAALQTALPATRSVLEFRNANLSAWTAFQIAGYTGFQLTGTVGAVLITPAQPDATRAKIRKALAKAYQVQGVV